MPEAERKGDFQIGWSTVDITPGRPVLVGGLFPARFSEGTPDPIKVTVMPTESGSVSYLPPAGSASGGSYGAVPASTLFSPEGGQELVKNS